MLTNPLSPLVQHRLLHDRLPFADAQRLAQIRQRTASTLTDPSSDNGPCRWCTTAELIAQAVKDERPASNTDIDQCHVDVGSLARRLKSVCASRPVPETRIAFVGDDDLASVAIMRMIPPAHTLLLDIDERILKAFRTEARRLGLTDRTHAIHVDLTRPDDVSEILDEHGDSYEIVVTDPPYAHDGMLRFIEVAAALTAFSGEIHAAVPAVVAEAWTDELLLAVQNCLGGNGFVLDQVQPGAFTYETSDVVSSLVIARRLAGAPQIALGHASTSRFYTTRVDPHRFLSPPQPEGAITS